MTACWAAMARLEEGSLHPRAEERGLSLPYRLALWALLASAFTAFQVQYSLRHGRLLVPPTYDDVVYLSDGLQRLETGYRGGPAAVAVEYVKRPPHSPFSSFLALLAFAAFGVVDWAPYAANALVVFIALVILDALTRSLPLAGSVALAATLLCIPITGMAVVDFRPDIACAVFTAGAVAVLLLPPEEARARSTRWAGALFGFALLVKPAVFIVTGPIAVVAFSLAVVLARRDPTARITWRRDLAASIGLAAAIAAPHFALTLPHYVSYFRTAIFSQRKPIEAMPGTVTDHLVFYLWGQGGQRAFGYQLPLLIALLIVGATLAARFRAPSSWPRLAAVGLVALAAFAIPTVSPVKQPFLGSQFAYLFALLALVAFARGAMLLRPRLRVPVTVLAAVVAVAGFSWPDSFPGTRPDEVAARNALPRQIHDAVIRSLEGDEARVYLTTTGYLGPELLTYLALKDGRARVTARSEGVSDDLRTHLGEMDEADFVLASEPGVAEASPYLPSTRVQAQTLALVRRRSDYFEIGRFPSSSGRDYFLFQRIRAFFGWKAGPGWLPLEGPYPQWNLPHVRWACHPSAVIRLTGAGGPPAAVVFKARTESPDQVVTLSIAGRPFHTHRFSGGGEFEEVRAPWPAGAPPADVELAFTSWSPADPTLKRAVLFNALQVLPVAGADAVLPSEAGSVRRSP